MYAFDFDQTLIDGIASTAVLELLRNGLPEEIIGERAGESRVQYINKVMKYMALERITPQQIAFKIRQMELVPG